MKTKKIKGWVQETETETKTLKLLIDDSVLPWKSKRACLADYGWQVRAPSRKPHRVTITITVEHQK